MNEEQCLLGAEVGTLPVQGQIVRVSGFGARKRLQTLCSRGARLCSAWPRALLC